MYLATFFQFSSRGRLKDIFEDLFSKARRIIKTYQNCGISRHFTVIPNKTWYLVFLSYILLALSSIERNLRKQIDANAGTIGQKCRMATSEILRSFVLWILKLNTMKMNKEQILNIVFKQNSKIGQQFQFA